MKITTVNPVRWLWLILFVPLSLTWYPGVAYSNSSPSKCNYQPGYDIQLIYIGLSNFFPYEYLEGKEASGSIIKQLGKFLDIPQKWSLQLDLREDEPTIEDWSKDHDAYNKKFALTVDDYTGSGGFYLSDPIMDIPVTRYFRKRNDKRYEQYDKSLIYDAKGLKDRLVSEYTVLSNIQYADSVQSGISSVLKSESDFFVTFLRERELWNQELHVKQIDMLSLRAKSKNQYVIAHINQAFKHYQCLDGNDHRLDQADQKVQHGSENSLFSHLVTEPDGQAKTEDSRNRDQSRLGKDGTQQETASLIKLLSDYRLLSLLVVGVLTVLILIILFIYYLLRKVNKRSEEQNKVLDKLERVAENRQKMLKDLAKSINYQSNDIECEPINGTYIRDNASEQSH